MRDEYAFGRVDRMDVMRRMAGWFLHLCYKLESHYVSQISIKNWIWAWVVVPWGVALFRHLSWWYAIPLSLAGLLLWTGIMVTRRKGDLLFEPAPLAQNQDDKPPLRVDEQVVGWASGLFAVEGKKKYLINEAAWYSFVRTREHIVMAHIKRTRFLLLAISRRDEAGWWYVFFKPEHVRRVETGYVSRGIGTCPGLALTYWPEGERNRMETIYMAFCDVPTTLHILADLRVDVSVQSFSPGV
jgi:hypothetical protein